MVFYTLLSYIGLGWFISKLIPFIASKIGKQTSLEEFKYGWIAITGASDGIGKGLATELANRGFKILLIGRNPEKLENVMQTLITKTRNPEIKWIQADFAYSHRNPETFYNDLVAKLSDYEISGLINNVGIANMKPFVEMTNEDIETSIGTNIYPQVYLTHKLWPSFISRFESEKKRTLVINLSSIAGRVMQHDGAMYNPTKAYNDFFSRAIEYENPEAVRVVSITPGPVASQMPSRDFALKPSPIIIPIDTYVNTVLNSINESRTCAHWMHMLTCGYFEFLPEPWRAPMIKLFNRFATEKKVN